MDWTFFTTNKEYFALGLFLIILVFIVIMLIRRSRKNKKGHEHNFVERGYFVMKDDDGKDNPRLVCVCECGVAIHKPIYTLKKLREKEEREYYEQNKKAN